VERVTLRPRRTLPLLVAVLLLALLAGCTQSSTSRARSSPSASPSTSTSTSSSSPSPSTSLSPSGTAPPNKIVWHSCGSSSSSASQVSFSTRITTECGTLTVPLDWSNPTGPKHVQVALVRLRSADAGKRIGSLLTNPGGPGASGIDFAEQIAPELESTLLQHFDLIGFDPRGIGQSDGLRCISAVQKDRSVALDPDPSTLAGFTAQATLAKQITAGCAKNYGNDLQYFSTESTVRDMDAMRAALGDKKLSYLGFSYGTDLGSVYATLYPQRVRALVLDGAVDPTASGVAESHEQAGGFETAFARFSAWCSTNASACPIAPNARQAVTALLAKAHDDPIPTSTSGDSRRATDGNVLYGVIAALYSKQAWPVLTNAISNATAGDAAGILSLDDSYTDRTPSGSYDNTLDANLVINCTDARSQPTLAAIRADQAKWSKQDTLFGGPLAITLLTCAGWSTPTDPPPTVRATGAAHPLLVVGTKGDPATPYGSAVTMTKSLGDARLLTADGDGHTAYFSNSCVRADVNRYLITGTLPAKGTVCPAD